MDKRDQQQGRVNRDYGARDYGDMPSVTNREWGRPAAHDDSFGPPELGGWGDFRSPPDREIRRTEADALWRSGERAMHGGRGRGPRNATRSDHLIAEELNERFTDDELLDASEILVAVEDGRVLLTGEVPERWMKHRAEDIADAVRGVGDIDNRIHVSSADEWLGDGTGAVRSGHSQRGSGFSSTPPGMVRGGIDNRVD